MPIKPVVPAGSPPPLAPYSPGARAGNVLYVSGTLALDAAGKVVGGAMFAHRRATCSKASSRCSRPPAET